MTPTIEDVLNRNGFDFDAFAYENEYSAKAIKAAMQEWASLQTPSNEKYGWIDVGVPPKKKGEYYLNVFSHRLGKDIRRIGHYRNGKWHIKNKVGPEDVIEWLDESTPIPLTPCVESEKEVERLKGFYKLVNEAYENCDEDWSLRLKIQEIVNNNL